TALSEAAFLPAQPWKVCSRGRSRNTTSVTYKEDPVGIAFGQSILSEPTNCGIALTERPNLQVLAGDRSHVCVIPTVDNPCFLWTSGAGPI
ncbi:mCG129161, partial [Mus musculus]